VLTGDPGSTREWNAALVSGTYFSVLGVQAWKGRLLDVSDETSRDGDIAAVLSADRWRSETAAGGEILGTSVRVNGRLVTVVGVGAIVNSCV
jgi:hypothetical protein